MTCRLELIWALGAKDLLSNGLKNPRNSHLINLIFLPALLKLAISHVKDSVSKKPEVPISLCCHWPIT